MHPNADVSLTLFTSAVCACVCSTRRLGDSPYVWFSSSSLWWMMPSCHLTPGSNFRAVTHSHYGFFWVKFTNEICSSPNVIFGVTPPPHSPPSAPLARSTSATSAPPPAVAPSPSQLERTRSTRLLSILTELFCTPPLGTRSGFGTCGGNGGRKRSRKNATACCCFCKRKRLAAAALRLSLF